MYYKVGEAYFLNFTNLVLRKIVACSKDRDDCNHLKCKAGTPPELCCHFEACQTCKGKLVFDGLVPFCGFDLAGNTRFGKTPIAENVVV